MQRGLAAGLLTKTGAELGPKYTGPSQYRLFHSKNQGSLYEGRLRPRPGNSYLIAAAAVAVVVMIASLSLSGLQGCWAWSTTAFGKSCVRFDELFGVPEAEHNCYCRGER